MKTFFINNSIVCGASVIGQSHIMNGTCNQDYFKIFKKKYGIAMSVCDGVGSNKYSQFGSKAASKAVNKVFKLYHKGKLSKQLIGENIERYYKKYVRRRYRKEASTTCLFAYVFSNNEIIIGQAGDGVILIKLDDKFLVFQNKTDDFMNEVSALSCNYKYNHWKIKNLKFDPSINYKLELLLSTDGISEDIIPEKREQFLDYFINLSNGGSKSKLDETLKNWSVPGSIDDKTVITYSWRK